MEIMSVPIRFFHNRTDFLYCSFYKLKATFCIYEDLQLTFSIKMESKEGKELERERKRGGKGEQGSRGREEGREICPILVPKGALPCAL